VTGCGPLGILAGGGSLPAAIATRVIATGRKVHIVGIEGEAERTITSFPHEFVNWGRIGRLLTSFRQAGCKELVIVGSVTRPDLGTIRPDFGVLRSLPTILSIIRAGGDDSVLRKVVRFFEIQRFIVRGIYDVAPDLLAESGQIGHVPIPASASADIARGLRLITALGPIDVGQAVAVADGQILAIEGAEGTDRMLKRLADQRGLLVAEQRCAASGVLVKRPKPGQELRIDLPAIGPRTIDMAACARLIGVGVEARHVLIVDRGRVIELAQQTGLFVAGACSEPVADPHVRLPHQRPANSIIPAAARITAIGRLQPTAHHIADSARGLESLRLLAPFVASAGVVVSRHHVLAIETGEGLARLLARVQTLRQWGGTANRRRQGVLAVPTLGPAPVWLMEQAAAAGLAGIAMIQFGAELGAAVEPPVATETRDAAHRLGLFLTTTVPR
jgi:UDP-2,3-diacylglucosamine hydrolase